MIARRITAVLISAATLALVATAARAQDAVAMPDAGYGAGGADTFQTPLDPQMPAPDDGTIPRSVTIPIPGGGSVLVEGPGAPANNSATPLSQWGVQSQNPNSSGTGALGP